jgi:hypothetical protein
MTSGPSRVSVNSESPAETGTCEGGTSEHRNTVRNAERTGPATHAARNAEPTDPATSRQRGSITYDRENGYDLEFESIDEFHRWRENEQRAHGIELRLAHTASSHGSAVYTASRLWVCARQGTGGEKAYKRKTDRKTKMKSKRLGGGCPCQVRTKIYPHTSTVLGKYTPDHSHPTGKDNLKHVRIRFPAREHIMELIRLGLMDKEIVREPFSYPFHLI